MNVVGKIVFIAQWVAVIGLPVILIVLPGAGHSGWIATIALVLSPVIAIGLLVGPIITVSVPAIRRTRTAPLIYSILSILLWVAVLFVGLSAEDSTDIKTARSSLEEGGLSHTSNAMVNSTLGVAATLLWIASIVALILSAIRASRAARAARAAESASP
jgi:hypothetical protein